MDAATEFVTQLEDAKRALAELAVAEDWRDIVDCARRFNTAIVDLPALAREQLIERFCDVAAEHNRRRR